MSSVWRRVSRKGLFGVVKEKLAKRLYLVQTGVAVPRGPDQLAMGVRTAMELAPL